jgi:hypothetical protein
MRGDGSEDTCIPKADVERRVTAHRYTRDASRVRVAPYRVTLFDEWYDLPK